MNWPTSQDYNEAVQDAANNLSDPGLKRGEVAVNAIGLPVPRSGNFADVYQFKDGAGKMWALKCFTRKVPGLRERYAKIDEHLAKARLPFAVGFKFMEEGISVKGQWFPLLKMEWVEGFTLNDFVAENLTKPQYLHALMQMWAKLAGRLRDANMAHADLQHGNVLLVPGATPQKLGLKLIDYDGMWVPALSEFHSGEVGHPNFQHPLRLKERLYNGDVDRFPHLVVAAGLRATLVGGKAIWDRFDNSDNLLFKESDLRDPAKAPVFKALWELNDPVLRTLVGHIALSSKQPLRKTPWLDDVLFAEGGPKLTTEEERQVCALLGVASQVAVTGKGAAPAKVEQEFNVFEFLDDDDSPPPERSARRPTMSMRKPKQAAKKSMLPLIIGGGAVAAVLVVGAIVAFGLGGKKKDTHPEIVQNKEDDKPKPPNRGTATTKDTDEIKIPVKDKDPIPPLPPVAPHAAAIGVAALPGGKDYLFIRQDDPNLYITVGGSARKAREVGRHAAAIRSLAVAGDGSRAITGADDGEVRVWALKETGSATDPRALMKTFLAKFPKMDVFKDQFGFEAYEEGIVVRDNESGKEQVVLAGRPGHAVKGDFKANHEKEAARFGAAITDEVRVFDGALIVQLFEGGTQFYHKGVDKTWYAWHRRRKAAVDSTAAEPAKPLKTKLQGPTKMEGFKKPYEFTLYREGIVIRDVDADKEVSISAGSPLKDTDPSFEGKFEYARLEQAYGVPVSRPTEVFDGALKIVLCRRGFYLNQTGTNRDWNMSGGATLIGDDGPPKDDPPPAKSPKTPAAPRGLKEHTGAVVACAVSSDGTRAVTVGKDRSLCEWDLAEPKLVRKFKVPAARSVAYFPDGKSVIIGTENESAGVWELASERLVTEMAGHKGPVRAVCVSPNADMAWTGGEDGTIRVWFFPDFKRSGSVPSSVPPVRSLAVSPNGRMLACVVADGSVRFFDAKTGRSAGGHTGKSANLALAFLSDGEFVAARDPDPIKVQVTREDEPTPNVSQEYLRPEYLTIERKRGNLLADGSFEEKPSKAWEPRSWRMNLTAASVVTDVAKSGKASAMLRPTELDDCMLVQKAVVKPRTQYLLSGWIRTEEVVVEKSGRVGANLSVVGGFEGSQSVVGTNDWAYITFVFDTGDRKEIEVGVRLGHNGSVAKGTAWFDDIVLVELGDPKVDPKPEPEMTKEQKEGLIKESESLSDAIVSCAFSTDGKKIYAATQKWVYVLDAMKLDELAKLDPAKSRISQMAVKPKTVLPSGATAPERLYLLDDNKHVHVWDPEKKAQVKDFSIEKVMAKIDTLELMVVTATESYLMGFDLDRNSSISWDLVRGSPGILSSLARAPYISATRCVAFTSDCRTGTAYASGKVLVWNVQTGADIRVLETTITPTWLGLVPDASTVVAAGRNHLQAWSYAPTPKLTLDVRDPHGKGRFTPFHAAVSTKGDCVATAGGDRWLRIWDVRTGSETAKWQMEREPNGIAMSPDGKFAIVWHGIENKISLWGIAPNGKDKK